MGIDVREIRESEYGTLHELALHSWKKSYYQTDHDFFDIYSEKVLRFNLNVPNRKANKLFGAYWKDRLVGSVGTISCDLVLRGKPFHILLFSWLSSFGTIIQEMVEKEGEKQFSWERLIQDEKAEDLPEKQPISFILGSQAGYHCMSENCAGFLAYFEDGHRSHDAFLKVVKSGGSYIYKYWDVKFTYPMVGLLDDIVPQHRSSSHCVKPYQSSDLRECLDLLNSIQQKVDFAQIWDEERLAWQLSYEDVSETVVFKEKGGPVTGFVNYILLDSYSRQGKSQFAVIENIHMDHLSPGQQRSFIVNLMADLKERGIRGLMYWQNGFFADHVFHQIGFVKEERNHFQSLVSFNKQFDADGITDTYIKFI